MTKSTTTGGGPSSSLGINRVSIDLMEQDPYGIRKASIRGRTIRAVAFPKDKMDDALNWHDASNTKFGDKQGVYVLIGQDDEADGNQLSNVTYIGKTDTNFRTRLSQHMKRKAFWQDTVIVYSVAEPIDSSRAAYMESALIRAAKESRNQKFFMSRNIQDPPADAGNLSGAARKEADEMIATAKVLVGCLGPWGEIFRERAPRQPESSSPKDAPVALFKYKGRHHDAEMEVLKSGVLKVKAGSRAKAQERESIRPIAKNHRNDFRAKGILIDHADGNWIFTEDWEPSSPSTAAGVIVGGPINGRTVWKLDNGQTYGEWEASRGSGREPTRSPTRPAQQASEGNPVFRINGDGYAAKMQVLGPKAFQIKAGSQARASESNSIVPVAKRHRGELRSMKTLSDDYTFTKDWECSSPSTAAGVITGASVNGNDAWKLESGQTYGEWKAGRGSEGILKETEPVVQPKPASTGKPIFKLQGNGYAAEMQVLGPKAFRVTAGSQARVRENESIPSATKRRRDSLRSEGILNDGFVFTEDREFRSATEAAGIIVGGTANGRDAWKRERRDGARQTYGEWVDSQEQ